MSLQLLTRNPSLHSRQDERIGIVLILCAIDVDVLEFLVDAAFADEKASKKEIKMRFMVFI